MEEPGWEGEGVVCLAALIASVDCECGLVLGLLVGGLGGPGWSSDRPVGAWW